MEDNVAFTQFSNGVSRPDYQKVEPGTQRRKHEIHWNTWVQDSFVKEDWDGTWDAPIMTLDLEKLMLAIPHSAEINGFTLSDLQRP